MPCRLLTLVLLICLYADPAADRGMLAYAQARICLEVRRLTPRERADKVAAGAFWRFLGMRVEQAEGGEATVVLPVKDELKQLYGVVHGGALATLVDGAIGVAAQTVLGEGEAATTVDLQVMYSRPAQAGVLTAKAAIIRRGKTIIFGECRVHDEAGHLIVHGNATYMVLEHERWSRADG